MPKLRVGIDVARNQRVWDISEAREKYFDVGIFSIKIRGGASLWNVEVCDY